MNLKFGAEATGKMSKQMKKPINGSGSGSGSGGFRAKMNHYLYSGEKKHVFGGIAIIGVLFGVPWYLMTRGSYYLLFVFIF